MKTGGGKIASLPLFNVQLSSLFIIFGGFACIISQISLIWSPLTSADGTLHFSSSIAAISHCQIVGNI